MKSRIADLTEIWYSQRLEMRINPTTTMVTSVMMADKHRQEVLRQ